MTVPPNVMRYGSPPLRQTAFVGAAHFGANPEKAQPRRCKRRNTNQKCSVVPRCPEPHGPQTVPNVNPQGKQLAHYGEKATGRTFSRGLLRQCGFKSATRPRHPFL